MNPTPRFCTNCKLQKGKDCTPDQADAPTKLPVTTNLNAAVRPRGDLG